MAYFNDKGIIITPARIMGHPVAPCKCANILERNIAQYLHYASLFTSSFVRKCMMKEVNILSAHFSFQANMDGDEGELVRFEKVKFYFRYVKQVL